jgi:NADPH:quinone reductase-like Zn-dependent oxidoreductase
MRTPPCAPALDVGSSAGTPIRSPIVPQITVCEVTRFGGPEVLRTARRPWPTRGDDQVVVKISATTVNPTDLAARSGAHRRRMPDLEPPFVPGWDLAAVVSDPGDSGWRAGAPVLAMIPWVHTGGRVGAYAQVAAVDAAWLVPRPAELDPTTGATVPLNALTARQALDLIDAPAGSTVLITGASGGVGGFATQLAAQDGLRVLAVASDGDERWVADLGAAEVLPRSVEFAALEPVDALLDAVPVGAPAAAAVRDGGVALFTRRVEGVPEDRGLRVETPLVHVDTEMLARLSRQVADGAMRTRVARQLPLSEAAEAHRLLERGGLRGKIVLTPG